MQNPSRLQTFRSHSWLQDQFRLLPSSGPILPENNNNNSLEKSLAFNSHGIQEVPLTLTLVIHYTWFFEGSLAQTGGTGWLTNNCAATDDTKEFIPTSISM